MCGALLGLLYFTLERDEDRMQAILQDEIELDSRASAIPPG
jgi:hypothetical protein